MTIAIAWVRKLRDCEELVFVSDSRLSGDGINFDGCPKILTLPRSDCAICFAGYTGHAFPMMLQLALAIDSHAPSQRGALDLVALRSHALKVFDRMASQMHSSPRLSIVQDTSPDASFIFGGYSWIKKRFQLWSVSYVRTERRFSAKPCRWLMFSADANRVILRWKKNRDNVQSLGRITFAGDRASVSTATTMLLARLNSDARSRQKPLDMEPFEVVRDMLRDPGHSESIGGAPQIVKVYQYMRTAPLGVFWPDKAHGKVHLQGRACLGYERIDRWVLDPDALTTELQPVPPKAAEQPTQAQDGV